MKAVRITNICFVLVATSLLSFKTMNNSQGIEGAWTFNDGINHHAILVQDGYLTHAVYGQGGQFVETHGGPVKVNNGQLSLLLEFDSKNAGRVGTSVSGNYSATGNGLDVSFGDTNMKWTRVDEGNAPLSGTWKITGRKQDGAIVQIHQTGPRKTLKMLTGTRFQWFAINPETKQFSGTGGGTYSFKDGKYTENIEFFSRDDNRVGSSLSFDGKIVDGDWHHSGKSSKGDDIYEVWSRITP